jgi:ferredoxin
MRVVVDRNLCESHGLCMASAPDVFELHDDDDVMYVLDEQPPESARARVEEAAQRCPKCAITIED